MSDDNDFFAALVQSDTSSKGNEYKAGKGVVIVKDVKMFFSLKAWKTKKRKERIFVFEAVVKAVTPIDPDVAPNAIGTTVSVVRALDTGEYPEMAQATMHKANMAALGPGADELPIADKIAATKQLLRIGGPDQPELLRGVTVTGTKCPQVGYNVGFETRPGNNGKHYPEFFAIETTPEQLAENLKILAGG